MTDIVAAAEDYSAHWKRLYKGATLATQIVDGLLVELKTTRAEMEKMRARPQCNHQWTTGTGPDDPADTGVHVCYMRWNHTDQHLCNCGATHD